MSALRRRLSKCKTEADSKPFNDSANELKFYAKVFRVDYEFVLREWVRFVFTLPDVKAMESCYKKNVFEQQKFTKLNLFNTPSRTYSSYLCGSKFWGSNPVEYGSKATSFLFKYFSKVNTYPSYRCYDFKKNCKKKKRFFFFSLLRWHSALMRRLLHIL